MADCSPQALRVAVWVDERDDEGRYRVVACEEGAVGYWPVGPGGLTYDAATRWAAERNDAAGLTEADVLTIRASALNFRTAMGRFDHVQPTGSDGDGSPR